MLLQQNPFPWVEQNLAAILQRNAEGDPATTDLAAEQFLRLLLKLRVVLLQDAAIVLNDHPDCMLLQHDIFLKNPEFKRFQVSLPLTPALLSVRVCARVECVF